MKLKRSLLRPLDYQRMHQVINSVLEPSEVDARLATDLGRGSRVAECTLHPPFSRVVLRYPHANCCRSAIP